MDTKVAWHMSLWEIFSNIFYSYCSWYNLYNNTSHRLRTHMDRMLLYRESIDKCLSELEDSWIASIFPAYYNPETMMYGTRSQLLCHCNLVVILFGWREIDLYYVKFCTVALDIYITSHIEPLKTFYDAED
jgi:hypothetical protein